MKTLWFLILVTVLSSCTQNEEEIITPPNEINPSQKLIKSYVINNKWEYSYHYNENSTLNEIVFKTDGVIEHTESFKYENNKIIESFKQTADGENSQKKQFEYHNNLIVKQILYLNDELFETTNFNYNNENLLHRIVTNTISNGSETSRITTVNKLIDENKIKVDRTNVATHIIKYDEKLTPQSRIPGYKPLVLIRNNGITNNILLTEVFVGDDRTTTIETDLEFDDDNETILNATTTYKSNSLLETQEFKYKY